jgi:hypothetical protein
MIDRTSAPTMDELQLTLQYFRTYLRGPQMPPISLSGLYDLFPDNSSKESEHVWPDSWPSASESGVYFVFDAELQVLYIGKASMNSSIGARLSTYFGPGPNKECIARKKEHWNGTPRYVAVISMQPDFRFEAPALEEYLITKLQPIDNTIGAGA